jgi:hypothetical protein
MAHDQMKPRDKVVLRMTRDGAVEENLTEGTSEKVSQRLEDAQLVKPHEDDFSLASEPTKRHTAYQTEDSQQKTTEIPNYDMGTGDIAAPLSYGADTPHTSSVGFGGVVARTAVTDALRKAKTVESLDGDVILDKAAQTASDAPSFDEQPVTRHIEHLERWSERAHERLDAAREKLPTKKVLKKERVVDEETGKGKTRLFFEDEIKSPKKPNKLQFEAKKGVSKVGDTLASAIHGKIHEEERENSGVEAAHKTEIAAETISRRYSHHRQSSANKPFEKVSRLEHKSEAADKKLHYEKTVQEHPEMKNHRDMNKHYQKQQIKKEYAAAKKAGSQTAGAATKSTGKKVREKAADKAIDFFSKNKKVFLWFGLGIGCIVLLAAGITSCTAMFTQTGQGVIASSYLSEDEAMLGAEEQYCQMEAELQEMLDNYESTHDYDEYHYDLDEIEHDPYVLVSILSALHEAEFTLEEIQGTLDLLFDKQYILTEEVVVETRYRTETDTWVDEDGNSHTDTYQVPYDYYICYVTLENFNLSHVPVYIMSEDQLSMYSAYMSVLGNREDLFPSSEYVDKYIENPPQEYEVNPAYLSDTKFATLIEEAEKYLNYPYVWGGSNPSTSFDCSGFVSYVLTNTGLVNTGRLGAQGLYNVCTPVSRGDAKPGDLIFFTGTYDTPGVSHVGIYVGDNVMLHCGDPIQYSSISSSYWQSHFYAFGRPSY